MSQPPQQGAYQRCFARTQITIKPDDHARRQQWRHFPAKRNGRRFIRQREGKYRFAMIRKGIRAMMRAMQEQDSNRGLAGDFDFAMLAASIKRRALALGFSGAGITRAQISPTAGKHLKHWLELGRHGEMDYMAKHAGLRTDPQTLQPGTLSIISVRLPYWQQSASEQALDNPDLACVSRYALGRDDHKTVRQRLQKLADFIAEEQISGRYGNNNSPFSYRVFSDSAPVMETEFARQSGNGWRGKHTLTLTRQGSWHFLGEIYTNLPLPPDTLEGDHCGSCRRCLDACPTRAIVAPYEVDARRCISYLT